MSRILTLFTSISLVSTVTSAFAMEKDYTFPQTNCRSIIVIPANKTATDYPSENFNGHLVVNADVFTRNLRFFEEKEVQSLNILYANTTEYTGVPPEILPRFTTLTSLTLGYGRKKENSVSIGSLKTLTKLTYLDAEFHPELTDHLSQLTNLTHLRAPHGTKTSN